jgi:chemotaxis protein methyltransferase CheR
MSLSVQDFEYIRTLVQQRSAIVLESDKHYLAETRLAVLARREGLQSVDELLGHLYAAPVNGLHQKVVEAMSTNETSFFRDVHPFENLRQRVLPELIARRLATRCLTIWCAACSSGQEPYSVAMLLREHFPHLTGWNVRILASDLSTEMLERARLGRYSQMEINRGLPAALLVKYFSKQGDEWIIKDDVRRMVEFRPINLAAAWPVLPYMDVVLLRNVLIYFDVATKKQILGQLQGVLRPDGYLFLGGAETTINLDEAYERVQYDRFSCYQLRKR